MKNIFHSEEWSLVKGQIKEWKEIGHKLVFTNGCFDVLHPGHEALLVFVRQQGGKALVGLNSDASVKKLKGEGRPVNTAEQRAQNLLMTGNVDAVVIFEEDTPQKIMDYLKPDVLIKGNDYNFETTVGASEVRARGGEVLFFKKIPGLSTTDILSRSNKKD